MTFEVTRQEDAGSPLLKLQGELDTVSAAVLDAALDDVAADWTKVSVDLSGLSYINSSGVRSFMRIERVFHACGLSGYFQFHAMPVQPPVL
jgi:anti-anti-sigma factor